MRCDNCGATCSDEFSGRDIYGQHICCPDCIFNPLGCRCIVGDYGQPETEMFDWEDPSWPD